MKKEHGVLYGIGVGPGDPDLMTIKALKNSVDKNRTFVLFLIPWEKVKKQNLKYWTGALNWPLPLGLRV